jgi:UDP-glucose 4-epimerase
MTKISRAIVTGGAGFIGSHIVDELARRGVETLVVDDFSTGSKENLRRHVGSKLVKVYRGDIRSMAELLRGAGDVDVVFHEAAIASVPISVEDPMRVHDTNVNATLEVLNFCLSAKVRRVVFASSAAVYGVLDGIPASEDMLCHPSSPYGASKLAVEDYLSAYHNTYGLETVALRYFNVFGPRQAFNNGYSGVITVFANRLLGGSSPTIFGDGGQTRDFIYVVDVVTALLKAMAHESGGQESPGARVYNVCTGKTTTLLELAAAIGRVFGQAPAIAFGDARAGDIRESLGNPAMARDILGFSANLSIEEGLGLMAAYEGRAA